MRRVYGLMFMASLASFAAEGDDILGLWYTAENKSRVEVYRAPNAEGVEKYWGKLVWFKDPLYKEGDPDAGTPVRDRKNPDPVQHDVPLLGYVVLKSFVFNEVDGAWDSGTIYDPEVGKVYKCTITMVDDANVYGGKRLDVRGYIGIPTLGRTTAWTRVPDEDLEAAAAGN